MRSSGRRHEPPGRAQLGLEADTPLAPHRPAWGGGEAARPLCGTTPSSRGPDTLDKHGGACHPALEGRKLVAPGREVEGRLRPSREAWHWRDRGLGQAERAQSRVDCLLAATRDPLWAPSTAEKHRRTLLRFLCWQEARGLAPGKGGAGEARGLRDYLQHLAHVVSGEALHANARSLLRTLGPHISPKQEARIEAELLVLRRDANKRHPPRQQAADPISVEALRELWARAGKSRLSQKERQALDIFLVAFATVSRVGEVAALGVEHVAPEGTWVALRPKTGARTWERLLEEFI